MKVLIVVLATLMPLSVQAQLFKAEMKVPNAEVLSAARGMCTDLFKKLGDGKTEEIAKWIVDQVGYTNSASEKMQNLSNFKLQLDLVLVSPPENAYGTLDGYDLIDESYLPGSDRFFRLVYLSYHEGAPLVWEFRFYVKPGNKVILNSIQWTPENPFTFMSTSDMLLPLWRRQR